MAGVELKKVRKSFGTLEVIHDVDLSIDDGELVVFVGPSGCGKSTLLRLICGLEPASGGDVLIGGKSMRGVNPARRGVAMVFQSYALYPHMTVGENMGFSLRMAGLSRREREQRVQHAAETLQLTELLHRKPKELSGGQRQRVAIGRAIVREPEVFLFDEPLSNLDAELRVQMRFELAKLHRALGATMIYVTHDQTEAMTLADRIVVMHAGVIEQVGTPMELYQAPRNRFVAGFIGSPRMNFLEGKIIACDRQTVEVEVPGQQQGRLTFNIDNTGMKPGDAITIGVRPEHFAPSDGGLPSLEVKVGFVEQFGGVSYSYAPEHPAGPLIIQTKEEMAMPRVGDRLRVGLQPARCHLFRPDSSAIRIHS